MSASEIALVRREEGPSGQVIDRARLDLVKKTVCPKGIGDDEFALFVEQCNRSGLDPLIKQAYCVERRTNIGTRERPQWAVKYEFQPAEGGMLARAEEFDDFRGCTAGAVCEKDHCVIDQSAGEVTHRFIPTAARGRILGAWARVVREGRIPYVVWLDYGAYAQQNSMWSTKGATMIEKCARVGALRKAYPRHFGGMYVQEEMPQEMSAPPERATLPAQPRGKELLSRLKENAPAVAAQIEAYAPAAEEAAALGVVLDAEEEVAEVEVAEYASDDDCKRLRIAASAVGGDSAPVEERCCEAFEVGQFELLPAACVEEALAWIEENGAEPARPDGIGVEAADRLRELLCEAFGAKGPACVERIVKAEKVSNLSEISAKAAADAERKASAAIDKRAAKD